MNKEKFNLDTHSKHRRVSLLLMAFLLLISVEFAQAQLGKSWISGGNIFSYCEDAIFGTRDACDVKYMQKQVLIVGLIMYLMKIMI
ncbi:MAG: hypothetical protein U9N51_02400 [Bacteroidota bacterium]|nr:hypothetical protein [Bacteroidota bacterium]